MADAKSAQVNPPGSGKKKNKKKQKADGDNKAAEKIQTQDVQKSVPGKDQSGEKGQKPPTDPNAPQKSKAELKAERRAKQEAQRAAKAAGKKMDPASANSTNALKKDLRVPDIMRADVVDSQKRMAKKLEKQQIPQRTVVQKKVGLFSHLHQYEREVSLTHGMQFSSSGLHPAILKLGLQYAEGVICGSNARCIALLSALKQVIADYTTPPQKELSRDLEAKIKPCISFLTQCRPLSVSMGNAIKYIKWHITHTPREMSDTEAKRNLYDNINGFMEERILLAGEAISKMANSKICDGDVILVYSCSSLIQKVLCDAHDNGKQFRVIVADGRPKLEGREMLRRLVKHGIKCSYVLVNAASYVMQEVTKVLFGAHGLLANGYVMSRVGHSQIALLAKPHNVPVLVCCETYKFCERVQTDSFVFNELGDPDDLVEIEKKNAYLNYWRDIQSLSLLNLMYDVTPPDFISLVITEIGMMPCTSVPVVLRLKQAETEA